MTSLPERQMFLPVSVSVVDIKALQVFFLFLFLFFNVTRVEVFAVFKDTAKWGICWILPCWLVRREGKRRREPALRSEGVLLRFKRHPPESRTSQEQIV
jgi:hypothetical protein